MEFVHVFQKKKKHLNLKMNQDRHPSGPFVPGHFGLWQELACQKIWDHALYLIQLRLHVCAACKGTAIVHIGIELGYSCS